MGSLPVTGTPLVGREVDLEATAALLSRPSARLLTILGPAGMGKTRLAIEVAAHLSSSYADGVYFVDLAGLQDPKRFLPAVAEAVGLEVGSTEDLSERLQRFLSSRCMLLVLDNFEQIVETASDVAHLVAASEQTRFIVTSRIPLQLSLEYRYPLQGLELPDIGATTAPAVAQAAAVELFLERASALEPTFVLNDSNLLTIAEICRRCDGVPLAIELAAAHVDVQAPAAILDGLKKAGLDQLAGGPRDLPERQQTLRAAIAWSERLLEPHEAEAFRRLSVFTGGFVEDAAVYVCNGASPAETRVALASLVRKNLLRFEPERGEAGRYRMLEMVREYALEQLRLSGAEADLRQRHLEWCLQLAEAAEPELRGRHQKYWMDFLEEEHENFRLAFTWCERTNRVQDGLRLCAAIGWFWQVRGYFSEGNRWCAHFLGVTRRVPNETRMWALVQAGWLANSSQRNLVGPYADEALQLAIQFEDPSAKSWALQLQARVHMSHHDYDGAKMKAEAAFAAAHLSDDPSCLRFSYFLLGHAARGHGRYEDALELYARGIALNRQAGDVNNLAFTLLNVGNVYVAQQDYAKAGASFREALAIARDVFNRNCVNMCVVALGQLARVVGENERAVRLYGAALMLWAGTAFGGAPGIARVTDLREVIGEQRFADLEAEGRSMHLEAAVAYALASDKPPADPVTAHDGLTPRETEVAALMARGFTDRQIADELVISIRTAERHTANILNKLGLDNRTQVAAWALGSTPGT